MITWLESLSWWAIAAWIAATFVLACLCTRALGRLEPPAGGEDPAVPPRTAPDFPLPGPSAAIAGIATIWECGCQRTVSPAGKMIGWRWCREHNPFPTWEKQLRETP